MLRWSDRNPIPRPIAMISGQLPGMTNALSAIPRPIDAQMINVCIYPAAPPSARVVFIAAPEPDGDRADDDQQQDDGKRTLHVSLLFRDEPSCQRLLDRRFDLGDLEGLAGDLGDRTGVDQILVAEQGLELALVHLRNDDPLVRP